MPWQLIYTSAPRGLLSGQSGFCTVARSSDLREALVQRLEQLSSYHYLRVSEAATAKSNPAISAYRLLDLRGTKYYVLTRIQPCGLDFTARTNHLAHHLIFQADELATLPSPAAILRLWPGWLSSWQGESRLLETPAVSSFACLSKYFLPARTWSRLTGDGGRAAGLLEGDCARGCYIVSPPGSEEQVLEMYCETLQLLNFNGQFPLRPWRHTFTSFLQAEDNPIDFHWRACQENTPAYQQAVSRSLPLMPLRSVRVPANSLVKLAREEPKLPPTATPPASASTPPTSEATKNKLSIQKRSDPPRPREVNRMKTPTPAQRPEGRVFNLSIHSATLASLGIFAAVLVVLLVIKHRTNRPVEQGNAMLDSNPKVLSIVTPTASEVAAKAPSTRTSPLDANQLNFLTGEGPTYILIVPNLTNFSLPVNSILPLGNLLRRYDKLESGALPNDIQLMSGIDRWDFPPGARLQVGGRKDGQFSATGSGFECVMDYAAWLAGNDNALAVQANIDSLPVPGAFSLHFGFASTNDGDPFRLLVVNEHNPPPPLSFPMQFVQKDRQGFQDSLDGSLRRCLLGNYQLLGGWQWQLRPYTKPRQHSAQYLYKDWPAEDRPTFGCELDFARAGQRLQTQRQTLQEHLDRLGHPLSRPLGKLLGETNDNLKDFLVYAPSRPTAGAFLKYLDELRKSAPDKSWIKEWHNKPDSDQPEEVSDNLRELYDLWAQKQPQDQSFLTVTNASGTTNYFFAVWRHLNENLKDWESTKSQLDNVQNRLVELDNVAYIGLFIVDPNQAGRGLEMIRFEGGRRIY
jgi:GTPase-associated protein 1, N-terminal domain type 2